MNAGLPNASGAVPMASMQPLATAGRATEAVHGPYMAACAAAGLGGSPIRTKVQAEWLSPPRHSPAASQVYSPGQAAQPAAVPVAMGRGAASVSAKLSSPTQQHLPVPASAYIRIAMAGSSGSADSDMAAAPPLPAYIPAAYPGQ